MIKNNKSLIIVSIIQTFVVLGIVFIPVWVNAGVVECKNVEDCNFNALFKTFGNIINFLVKIGIALSAIGIAIAGWYYMTNAGDEGKIKKAHSIIKNVIIGLLILLCAYLIIKLLFGVLGVKEGFNSFPKN